MSKHSFKDWVLATRPWSFPASSMPVIVSTAWLHFMGFKVSIPLALLSLFTIIMVHAAGNVWSDYFDYRKKVDRDDNYSVKTLTSGQFSTGEFMKFSIVLQVIAIALGILLVCLTGLPTLYVGLAGLALSLLYPLLKYNALGDVVIFLCYAVLPMTGMSYILTGDFHWNILLTAVPVGRITDAILHTNNTRDIRDDAVAGIKTFAMLIGKKGSAYLFIFEMLFPFVFAIAIAFFGFLPIKTVWLILLALPIAIKNVGQMAHFIKTENASDICDLDEKSAKLQMAFSLLLSIAMIIPV